MKGATALSSIMRWATAGILAFALSACGGGAVPPVSGPPSGTLPIPGVPTQAGVAGPAIDSCMVLSDAEIEAVTGAPVAERRRSTLTQVFPSACDIITDGGGELAVGVRSPGGRSMYETSFEPLIGVDAVLDEAIPGLGDKAARSGQNLVMVLSGDVLFQIHYVGGPLNNLPAVRYLAERILARLPCIATGCPELPLPPVPTPGPVPTASAYPSVDPGQLPSTGARARVVNLYTEEGQGVDLDVYAWTYSTAEMKEVAALVATVPYGQASAWFNPGLAEAPFSTEPYTRVSIERHGEPVEQFNPLAQTTEFLGPGTVTTISVWTEETFDDMGAWQQTIYAEHPDYETPVAPPGQALLVSRLHGLLAEEDSLFLYASVGDGCLESPIGRSDPDIPNAQPISNDVVLPPGDHTLTVHDAPFGEVPTCEGKALGPGVPISVAEGDRWILFPYRLPGTTEISQLVLPFDE